MTPLQEYRSRKNYQTRKYGGSSFICPGCGGDIDHRPATDTYTCSPCGWAWDHKGDEIKTKEKRDA